MNLQWSGSEIVQLIVTFQIKESWSIDWNNYNDDNMRYFEHYRLKVSNIFAWIMKKNQLIYDIVFLIHNFYLIISHIFIFHRIIFLLSVVLQESLGIKPPNWETSIYSYYVVVNTLKYPYLWNQLDFLFLFIVSKSCYELHFTSRTICKIFIEFIINTYY